MKTIQPAHRALLYVALFLHDIAKGRIEDHSIAGARIARRFCPRLGLSPAETDTVAWLVEQHLVMSTIAQSRDLSDRKTIENFAAVVQSLERMKLLAHPHHRRHPRGRARGVELLEGAAAAHALLRDRAGADRRLLGGGPRRSASRMAQAEFRAEIKDWPAERARRLHRRGTTRPTGSRSTCRTRSRTRISSNPRRPPARRSRPASASTPRAA